MWSPPLATDKTPAKMADRPEEVATRFRRAFQSGYTLAEILCVRVVNPGVVKVIGFLERGLHFL